MTNKPEQETTELKRRVWELGTRAKAASRELAQASTEEKNQALASAADLLEKESSQILQANQQDIDKGQAAGMAPNLVERLTLTEERIAQMADGLRQIAELPDPVGEVLDGWKLPNGLKVQRERVPLGVVAIIYESRPNVTSDAAGLCLKSSNVALLRGSGSALHSNRAIAEQLRTGIADAGLNPDALVLVDEPDRQAGIEVMQLDGLVDCLIPRGGAQLIQSIEDNATVPVIIDGAGNCHVYIDAEADSKKALDLVENAKTNRTSVCNSAESLLIHTAVAPELLPRIVERLTEHQVELVGDKASTELAPGIKLATDEDFSTEFLSLKMSVAVVDDVAAAVEHINEHGTGHTEAIITEDIDAARTFTEQVDAAVAMVNTSTRFTDGDVFGFGAEIGISTQKLHARGPMGLRELTTYKYVVWGDGQVRN